MARSSSIWVVTNELGTQGGPPTAAFTVKRELEDWLNAQSKPLLAWLHVWRCENPAPSYGGHHSLSVSTPTPVEVDICDIIGCSCDPRF